VKEGAKKGNKGKKINHNTCTLMVTDTQAHTHTHVHTQTHTQTPLFFNNWVLHFKQQHPFYQRIGLQEYVSTFVRAITIFSICIKPIKYSDTFLISTKVKHVFSKSNILAIKQSNDQTSKFLIVK
jgi:hypothetical protein